MGERKILSDVSKVSIGHKSSLPKTTLALAVLALQQVASPLFPTKNFSCPSDFETLGNGFPCFCFSSDSWHGAGKLGNASGLARRKWVISCCEKSTGQLAWPQYQSRRKIPHRAGDKRFWIR
jgi:hypothetical protein